MIDLMIDLERRQAYSPEEILDLTASVPYYEFNPLDRKQLYEAAIVARMLLSRQRQNQHFYLQEANFISG